VPSLDFKGKQFVYSHHLSVPFRELKIDAKKSLPKKSGPSLDDNLIIHGDNLHALKALLPKYAGKVDVIYIDPPYNTGNEGWAYNDNVNSPLMKEWLGKIVDRDDLERYDKWLCMMWPRLVLLRELLSENGSIFISIDDDEQHSLRLICDEIFGRENFINNAIWQKKYAPANDAKWFSDDHDFVLIYSKSKDIWRPNKLPRTDKQNSLYKNPDNDPNGDWMSDNYTSSKSSEERPTLYYPITNPNTGEEIWPDKRRVWRSTPEQHAQNEKEGRVWWGKNGKNSTPRLKRYLSDVGNVVPRTIWKHEDAGHTQSAKKEIMEIFSDRDEVFGTPKPVALLNLVLTLSSNKGSLILDSFAGSATTAHAVKALNAEDGGNRKFILIETEDYADTITAERVRRVIKGVPNKKDENLRKGLGGSFTYCELGDPIDMEAFFGDAKSMPAYDQLARYIAYTATGEALDKAPSKPTDDWFIGEVGGVRLHLIYKPDNAFMRDGKAALNADLAALIKKNNTHGKPTYVFAGVKYMGQKDLTREFGITFCQLPYSIYRIMGDSVGS
jgi:adenine-specific DNA-methyltransferase